MKYVRGSEVSSFLRCRKAWKYSWIDQIEPRRPDGKLFFGNLAHKFFEVYYKWLDKDSVDLPSSEMAMIAMKQYFYDTDTSHMQQTELDELWELAEKVMNNYVDQWSKIDRNWTVLAMEFRFAIPLDSDTMYEGTIDLIYLDEHGKLFFMDHKNVGSIERYVGMAEMDRQISRYYWALQQLARGNGYIWSSISEDWMQIRYTDIWHQIGEKEPSGFVYNLILKDFPTVPEILKKGGLSVAKNQKTDYATYWQAMLDNQLISFENEFDMPMYDGKYKDILDHLSSQETEFGNRFFRRVPVTRNESEVQAAMQEFMAVVSDMETVDRVLKFVPQYETEKDDGLIAYRNINADCSWCNYKALCVAEMSGDSAEFIRNTLYRTKESNLDVREEAAE